MATIPNIYTISKMGDPIIIRSAIKADALNVFTIQQSVVAENDYVITTLHDFNKTEVS